MQQVKLVFGTLYPAYASYKAVRTKNLKEYVKWMMYWIVFALFTCTETFTDVFLSWFPFYYEVKIVLVLWLLSPATKGSSILYRKFVHPALCRREQEIDEYIAKAKDQGYHTVLNLGTKGVNYATTVIMQTAIKGGGGLVQQLRKSYSLSDLTECEPREERGSDEADDVLAEPRLIRRGGKSGFTTRRSASESNSRSPMYFPEVDVDVRPRPRSDEPDFSHIKSSEDISSGYSSADNSASLSRAASLGAGARARGRAARTSVTAIKRPQAAEESEVIIEELQDDDSFEYANMPALINLPSQVFLSHTQPPFIYQYVGDQVKILQVLGNFPLDANVDNQTDTNTVYRDQKDVNSVKTLLDNAVEKHVTKKESIIKEADIVKENDNVSDIPVESQQKDNKDEQFSTNKTELDETATKEIDSVSLNKNETESTPHTEITSFETSVNDNDSVESDDEASFGTPDHSPKSKRKFPKGKYGKGKAPPPPKDDIDEVTDAKQVLNTSDTDTIPDSTLSDEEKLPNISVQEAFVSKGLPVNQTNETKKRHKSKSPARAPKGNSSGFGKLLQLPGKLAFWNKQEEKPKSDSTSTSSDDNSRRSSTIEKTVDDFQSCTDLNTLVDDENRVLNDKIGVQEVDKGDDQISFADASDLGDAISDKSNALQRLIEAKIESHPEYKIISLHDNTPTTSKSTDV
ncbi:uncharacterized protein LOC113498244 isoform X2 [Trichoplusia ni]|uniref:Uncharacterized protein LOC113498244 isoform X2 n=1 Tax=Trichoplusia ni TaxID=7111 RepID=A0A7E5W043_TRINI|nr:uncharacterized protein LOC113498244 isoform X2 [Trichoplusia ni]